MQADMHEYVCMYFTLLVYAPEEVSLLHYICMSHCTATVVCILTPHNCIPKDMPLKKYACQNAHILL